MPLVPLAKEQSIPIPVTGLSQPALINPKPYTAHKVLLTNQPSAYVTAVTKIFQIILTSGHVKRELLPSSYMTYEDVTLENFKKLM